MISAECVACGSPCFACKVNKEFGKKVAILVPELSSFTGVTSVVIDNAVDNARFGGQRRLLIEALELIGQIRSLKVREYLTMQEEGKKKSMLIRRLR